MELNDLQKDALTELINIAFSRTAASLSELTGNRVELEVPEVSVHPIAELTAALARFVNGEVATVHQVFSGPVAGDALLLLNHAGAVELVALLTGEDAPPRRLEASAKEVLTEIGNILLNSCMGVFGNVLQVNFSFTVPRLHMEALNGLLKSLVIGKDELRHALLVGAKFRLRGSVVTGCLVLILGVASLDILFQAIETWAEGAVPPLASPKLPDA
ncbi:MAG: chemotaxis protein CheC [Gemmataceae bacterium]|nr:chemotaxis protein CheC [Gemmataceae bacterium]